MKRNRMKISEKLITVFVLALLLAVAVSISATAERVGSGTESSPWLISSETDFGSFTDEGISCGYYLIDGGYYKLTQDVDIGGYLYANNTNVTLDLNGYTLRMTSGKYYSRVIYIATNGNLTLRDSSGNNSGVITGSARGPGVGVYAGSTFRMEGGTITGNKVGVRLKDYNLYKGCTFIMTGGVITGNTEESGVERDLGTTINISGSAVIADPIQLAEGAKINITGPLDSSASICVKMDQPGVFTSGLSGNGSAGNYISHDSNRTVGLNGDGEAALSSTVSKNISGSGTVTTDRNPAAYFEGETVSLTVNPGAGCVLKSLSVSGAVLNDDYTFTMPAGDVTVNAEFVEANRIWNGDRTISETADISGDVTVSQSMTLTLDSGVTLTLEDGIRIADGCTLTVDGAGELFVYGTEGEIGVHGEDGSSRIVPAEAGGMGGEGQPAIRGNLTVNGGKVYIYGGIGGRGGKGGTNKGYKGGNGGTGGTGGAGIDGSLTLNGGTVYINGGYGGSGGTGGKGKKAFFGGYNGKRGSSGPAVSGTIVYSQYVTVKESEESYTWSLLSGNVCYAQYLESYVTVPHNIILPENPQGGTVTATVNGEPAAEVFEGDTVTLTATVNENYQFAAFTATCNGVDVETIQQDDLSCTFAMPAGDVTVNAEFSYVPNISTIQGLYIELDGENIEYSTPVYPYTGEAVEPTVSMYYYDQECVYLTVGTDFTVACTDNTGSASEVTEATMTITGIGNYSGTMAVPFKISPLTLEGATVDLPDQSLQVTDDWTTDYIFYKFEAANNNEEVAERIGAVVTDRNGQELTFGTDYLFGTATSLWENGECNRVGEPCTVEIIGAGDYTGTLTASFKIKAPVKDGLWGENIAWDFDDGVLTLWGEDNAVMQQADSYDDYPWYTVCSDVTGIDIQEGITSIADMAFGGDQNINPYANVRHITLAPTVKTIGNDAFAFMTGLYTIDNLENVTAIGSRAFNQCRMLNAYVPATVTRIGDLAFGGCTLIFYNVSIAETEGGEVSVTVPQHDEPRPQDLPEDLPAAVEDATVTITLNPNPGYLPDTLTVTDLDGNPITVTDNSFVMPASPVTVAATFLPIDYTITATLEHASLWLNDEEVADITQPVTAHCGDAVQIVPEEGFALDTVTVKDADDLAVEVVDGVFIMPASSVYVTVTSKQQFTVAFDSNGGTGTIDSRIVDSGTTYTLPTSTAFTAPENKVFKEWSVVIGTGEAVVMDPTEEIIISGDTMITAVWQEALPDFGDPDFTMPSALTTIEESAFEGNPMMTIVDASNCTAIGINAFKGCTNLTQIRLPADCQIDPTAFSGCGTVYVFAPAGDSTETFCNQETNDCIFVAITTTP